MVHRAGTLRQQSKLKFSPHSIVINGNAAEVTCFPVFPVRFQRSISLFGSHLGPVTRSVAVASANHWSRSMETYTLLW